MVIFNAQIDISIILNSIEKNKVNQLYSLLTDFKKNY